MNTMIDLDPDVLGSVQAIADREHKTLGAVLSELARHSLRSIPENQSSHYRHGFRVLPKRSQIITSEHVRHLLEDALD